MPNVTSLPTRVSTVDKGSAPEMSRDRNGEAIKRICGYNFDCNGGI